MATRVDNSQVDLEDSDVDSAAKAVRALQAGRGTLDQCRKALKALKAGELELVAIMVRLPASKLEMLKNR